MKKSFSLLLILGLTAAAQAATKAGVTFGDAIKLKKNQLVLNGLGVREATMFKVDVYVAGIYLPKKTSDARAIINSKSPKILKIQFVREVTGEQMNEAWDASLTKEAQNGNFTPELAKLKKAMPEKMKKGDLLTFAFGNGNTYLMINNKKRAAFKGELFAKSLLGVWFGANPPNEGLKKGLLGIN